MVALGLVAATFACRSDGTDGDLRCAEGDAARPLLIGFDDNVQRSLLQVAEKGLVVVNAEPAGCSLHVSVLADCTAPGQYTYQPNAGSSSLMVKRAEDVEAALPHAGADFHRAFALFGALKVQTLRAGKLVASSADVVLDRRALRGQTCAAATHVMRSVSLGAYGVAAVEPDRLAKVGDLLDVSLLAGYMTVRRQGRKPDCDDARSTGRRKAGCAIPIQAELEPLETKGAVTQGIEIAAGRFTRAKGDPTAGPEHLVRLEAYVIDATEVSVGDYRICVAAGQCTPAGTGRLCTSQTRGRATHPINCVSWRQAVAYCDFVGKRLPTEAEWERAAVDGHGGPFPWGSEWPPPAGTVNLADAAAQRAHPEWHPVPKYRDGFAETAPVGALGSPNQRVRNLGGNVMEWTGDYFGPYERESRANPTGPRQGTHRVVRGASFGQRNPRLALATSRKPYLPDVQSGHIGFRCAKNAASR